VFGTVGYALSIWRAICSEQHHALVGETSTWLLKQRHDVFPSSWRRARDTCSTSAVFDRLSEARSGLMKAAPFPNVRARPVRDAALGPFSRWPRRILISRNQSFGALQSRISELENQIADRREFYNDTVTTYNTRIQQLPDKFVADWCQYEPAEVFRATDSDRQDVEIKFRMSA
jgi:LemA protein